MSKFKVGDKVTPKSSAGILRKEDNAQTKDYISVHGKSFSRQNRQAINAKFRELKRKQEQAQ